MYGKSNMESYITVCKIDIANGNLAQETQTGALYQCRWVGEMGGRFKTGGNICIPMADLCWGLTENIIL